MMRRPLLDILLLSLLLVTFAAQNSATAKGLTFEELKQRSLKVEKKSQIERETLQRNWQTFQALPEDQKQRYRQLHQDLEADKKSGNQLNATLEIYETWLQTLAPSERVALRQATSPADRLRLVRQIKQDKERRNQSRALSDPVDDPSPRWDFRKNLAPPLSSKELGAVMDALAGELSLPEQDEIKRFDPVHDQWLRFKRIIDASARQAGGPQNWPNPNQQLAMAAAIPQSDPARQLKNLADDQRRVRWGSILFSSFREEWKNLREPFRPKESDLTQLFESLEPIEREKWMSFPKDRLKQHLIYKYYQELDGKNADYRKLEKTSREFSAFAYPFMQQAGFGPGGFFRGGPPGQNRRFGGLEGMRDGRGGFRNERNRDGQPPDRSPRDGGPFQPPPDGDRPPRRPDPPKDGE